LKFSWIIGFWNGERFGLVQDLAPFLVNALYDLDQVARP
jgi:hypothetical protein